MSDFGLDFSFPEKYRDLLPEHTQLRAQFSHSASVALLKGNLVRNSSAHTTGVNARTWNGGVFGFAAEPSAGDEAIRNVLAKADANARLLAGRVKRDFIPVTELSCGDFDDGIRVEPVPQNVLLDYAKAVDDYIAGKYPDLASRAVSCRCESRRKVLLTAAGGSARHTTARAHLVLSLSAEAKDGSGAIDVFDAVGGGFGSFTDHYSDPALVFEKIDRLYEDLMKKVEGVFPDAGVADVVIDSALAGMLAHEAVGHTTEADLVLAGSVAGPLLGKQVASPLVSLTDFAYEALGEKTPLPVYVDDEGTPCSDVEIIKDGILTGFMTSQETATHFDDMPARGNARGYSFGDEPLVRMRNTCIHPGKDKLEDMIASIDHGYYLLKSGNGQADTTGEFMFGVTSGYEIEHGKIGRALRDTTISGVAFDMLRTVDMVSDELSWDSVGTCGKKQPMTVSMGGPAIKCRVNIGGR